MAIVTVQFYWLEKVVMIRWYWSIPLGRLLFLPMFSIHCHSTVIPTDQAF